MSYAEYAQSLAFAADFGEQWCKNVEVLSTLMRMTPDDFWRYACCATAVAIFRIERELEESRLFDLPTASLEAAAHILQEEDQTAVNAARAMAHLMLADTTNEVEFTRARKLKAFVRDVIILRCAAQANPSIASDYHWALVWACGPLLLVDDNLWSQLKLSYRKRLNLFVSENQLISLSRFFCPARRDYRARRALRRERQGQDRRRHQGQGHGQGQGSDHMPADPDSDAEPDADELPSRAAQLATVKATCIAKLLKYIVEEKYIMGPEVSWEFISPKEMELQKSIKWLTILLENSLSYLMNLTPTYVNSVPPCLIFTFTIKAKRGTQLAGRKKVFSSPTVVGL